RFAKRVQVFLDVRGTRKPEAQDQEHDADDEDDEPDRGDEPVPGSEDVERAEFPDADLHHVVQPGPQRDARPAKKNEENPGVEQELLSKPGLGLLRAILVAGLVGLRHVRRARPAGRDLLIKQLSALRTFRRIEGHDRLTGRTLRDDVLRLRHGGNPLPRSEAIVVSSSLSNLISYPA